jgi:hypothetical protein
MLAELDAIRRELESAPPSEPPPETSVKTKGHGKLGKPAPPAPPRIRQEGQQIRMPSPAELFE